MSWQICSRLIKLKGLSLCPCCLGKHWPKPRQSGKGAILWCPTCRISLQLSGGSLKNLVGHHLQPPLCFFYVKVLPPLAKTLFSSTPWLPSLDETTRCWWSPFEKDWLGVSRTCCPSETCLQLLMILLFWPTGLTSGYEKGNWKPNLFIRYLGWCPHFTKVFCTCLP